MNLIKQQKNQIKEIHLQLNYKRLNKKIVNLELIVTLVKDLIQNY